MGAAYTILGKSVPSHQLAIATLGAVAFYVAPKPWGAAAPTHPSINASSPEEEKYVTEWLAKHTETKH
ncbi:ATP synthase subunit K, mitochondrial [[Candida] railenensis]|uniref:ATP synthase subunit K, mitochondrial n=1 Tax=[Candida] railenensis TaxID=45579 RepID=A0A9P0QPB5_9ASCO|nr:ATP synthase subunit K, mitochondrial [[Candida] railenensis]